MEEVKRTNYSAEAAEHILRLKEALAKEKALGKEPAENFAHAEAVIKATELLAEIADLNSPFNTYHEDNGITISTMLEVICGTFVLMLVDVDNRLPYHGVFGQITEELLHVNNVITATLPLLKAIKGTAKDNPKKQEEQVH